MPGRRGLARGPAAPWGLPAGAPPAPLCPSMDREAGPNGFRLELLLLSI